MPALENTFLFAEPSLEYIAGFLDADGTIGVSKTKCSTTRTGVRYSLRLSLSNTSKEVLELIQNTLPKGRIIKLELKKPRKWKTNWQLGFSGLNAKEVLHKLMPYLVIKHPQAELALKFQDLLSTTPYTWVNNPLTKDAWEHREYYYQEIKRLKKSKKMKTSPSSPSLPYIAGFFDGDGCVMICRRHNKETSKRMIYDLFLTFTNRNKRFLKCLQHILGAGAITRRIFKNTKWNTSYMLVLASKKAEAILKKLLPYLIIKRSRAELGLDFQKTKKSRSHISNSEWLLMESYYKNMGQLNRRGDWNAIS